VHLGRGDVCAAATSQLSCGGTGLYTCKIQCGAKKTCEVAAIAEQFTDINLSSQIKNKTQASALSKVSLQNVLLDTVQNTLTFDTPQVDLFVGPTSATSSTDTGVVPFVTLPPIPKGQTVDKEIPTSDAGKSALAGFVKNFQTPFRMFGRASVSLASGDPVPQGKLELRVKAIFEVEPL